MEEKQSGGKAWKGRVQGRLHYMNRDVSLLLKWRLCTLYAHLNILTGYRVFCTSLTKNPRETIEREMWFRKGERGGVNVTIIHICGVKAFEGNNLFHTHAALTCGSMICNHGFNSNVFPNTQKGKGKRPFVLLVTTQHAPKTVPPVWVLLHLL